MIDSALLIWLVAAFVAIATPLLGYFSPFGRTRRGMVAQLQAEIEVLAKKVANLEVDVEKLTVKLTDSERERGRLERENYRLYRELDGAGQR